MIKMYRIEFERKDGSHFVTAVFKIFAQATMVWQKLADHDEYVHGKLIDIENNEIIWSF